MVWTIKKYDGCRPKNGISADQTRHGAGVVDGENEGGVIG